jgi:protein-S-isoprenylcysteine O-methyltransferase Ste14
MTEDTFFRWAAGLVLTGTVVTSGVYRARADRLGGTLPRKPEGLPSVMLRLLMLSAVLLPILAPSAVRWLSIDLPTWARAIGLGLSILAWPILWWTLASIGTNISQSISTRADATLVTHGPYRLVRHPLYSAGFLAVLGMALSVQSIPLMVAVLLLVGWIPRRAEREEANLTASFGDAYRAYREQTGRFIPRLIAGA